MKTRYEIGCYGDGTFGHPHTRKRCAAILRACFTDDDTSQIELAEELEEKPMSDDASEEYEACDWLNKHAAVDGASWDWRDGDFGLWPISEEG